MFTNNYDATLRAIATFIIQNAPPGAERESENLRRALAAGETPGLFGIEFRNADYDSCALYVRIESDFKGVLDEEGNRWHSFKLSCQISWPSYGSGNLKMSQRRLAMMTEVARFAAEIERAFPGPIQHMTDTKEQIEARKAESVKQAARQRVERLIRANMKGMRQGQERRVEVPGDDLDLMDVGSVEVRESDRKYTVLSVGTRAFYFTRTA